MSAKTKVITLLAILVICVGMIVYGTVSEGTSIMAIMPRLVIMGLTAIIVIIRITSNSPKKEVGIKGLEKDIAIAKKWIKMALESSGYRADFSLESLKDIDRFFDEQTGENGILSKNTGRILFGLGVYLGETIISVYGGKWDLDGCKSETHISVRVDENTVLLPVIRIMARYEYGVANSIYAYGCCVKKNKDNNPLKADLDTSTVEPQSIDEIWQIEEKENFIAAMHVYIGEKCKYGDEMEALNSEQRVFYITQALESEVNNGGFSQFFLNSDGVFANELVASFERIGAKKAAEICKNALSIFGNEIPTDRDVIQEIISTDDENEEERIDEILEKCDDAFFEYEDDLTQLNYQFIIDNKDSFSE